MSFSSLLFRGLKKGRWVWNDDIDQLHFVSSVPDKRQQKKRESKSMIAMNGLTYATLKVNITFKSSVSEGELMDFRHYLRWRNHNRTDTVVTIQDVKIVAIFLCRQQLPRLFHKFYNLKKVNQLLRACIVYMEFYLQTCESILKTQHLLKTRPQSGCKTTYQAMKDDLDDLRVLIGRFYAGIIFAELGMGGTADISRTDEILLFEYFLRVSTIVVWIALERKYLGVIKTELGRIFRTGYFNNFNKNEEQKLLRGISKDEHIVVVGRMGDKKPGEKRPDPLRSNSPIIHNFMLVDEQNLLIIGREDFKVLRDDRLRFFTEYIFEPEYMIRDHGVSIGILGYHRRLFDPLLYPCSKRTLKLLVTGSPMDISEDRRKLRDVALDISLREIEPDMPHIFDYLPKLPMPNTYTEEVTPRVETFHAEEIDPKGRESLIEINEPRDIDERNI